MVHLIDKKGPVIEEIASKEYWGRMIIAGRLGNNDVLAYFPTGRSAGSKAVVLLLMKKMAA